MYNPYNTTSNYDNNPYRSVYTDNTRYIGYNVPTTTVSNNI